MKLRIKRDKLFDKLAEPLFDSGKLDQLKQYVQHGSSTCYDHSIAVAKAALSMSLVLPFRFCQRELVRGALLHDYFLYDWHVTKPEKLHGFSHPYTAKENAKRDFDLTAREENIIVRHMFPLTPVPPKYRESILVCLADKYCATIEVFVALGVMLRSRKIIVRVARLLSLLIALLPWK